MDYASLYDKEYYERISGGSYHDAAISNMLRTMTDKIYGAVKPKTVLEVGCASGHMVARFRELGVSAFGIDISKHAVANAAKGAEPYLREYSILDGIPPDLPQKYDLVVSIECLEHLYEEDGKKAVEIIAGLTDEVVFSASADDFDDPTHFNVQPSEYWVLEFAKYGFHCYGSATLQTMPVWAQRVKRTDSSDASRVNAVASALVSEFYFGLKSELTEKEALIYKYRETQKRLEEETEHLRRERYELHKKIRRLEKEKQ